jgi:hypothetical protein
VDRTLVETEDNIVSERQQRRQGEICYSEAVDDCQEQIIEDVREIVDYYIES